MSVSRVNLSPSLTRPMLMPATGSLIGTPASIRASVPPQTDAMLDEPLDSRRSLTRRIVYGHRAGRGRTAWDEPSARAPWPISRRPGPPTGLHSPTEYGGKL